jgi:hypothetical protein
MNAYMVERNLKGISMADLAAAQQAAIRGAAARASAGTPIRYLRSTFVPDEGRCLCLFAAPSSEDVRRLNDELGLPYARIVPVLDLTPAGAGAT